MFARLFYGLALNLSFWPFVLGESSSIAFVPGAPVADNLGRFIAFTLAMSLGFDIPRALWTGVLILITGARILRALRRAARRAAFDASVTFRPLDRSSTVGRCACGGSGSEGGL